MFGHEPHRSHLSICDCWMQPFHQTQPDFPSTEAAFRSTARVKKSVSEGETERERADCEALMSWPLFMSYPPLVSLALTVYLAWHFHNNHFGLSHSAVWRADVCQGTVFLCIHTALIKINHSYHSVCVCVCWMSQFLIHKAMAVLYNTVDEPITFPFNNIILPFSGTYTELHFA